jgi:hypothetical protein
MLQNMYARAHTHEMRSSDQRHRSRRRPNTPTPPVRNRKFGDTGTFSSIQKDEIMPVDLANQHRQHRPRPSHESKLRRGGFFFIHPSKRDEIMTIGLATIIASPRI